MKTIVIYKSRTGFTKQYAEWIADELKCDIADYKDINKINLDNFELVIYGGRVHAGKIDSLAKVKEIFKNRKCNLIVFATGATPNAASDEIEKTMKNNFSDDSIPHFYMQSGLCYEKMGFIDKTIMKMLVKMLSSKENKTDIEKGALAAISKSNDISDRSYIIPLVEFVKKNHLRV